jgi:leucyl aminopeptidase
VGKAVTFDSGGISLKPGAGMHDMKFDKSGGVAVLGAMKAIAGLKPGVKVYGIIPSAENMPGGESYRPGDIVTTYSGKTVEIQNTDAEGRMILCDAIHQAVKLKCDVIVDIATLTGACVVALGEGMAGVMSHDDKLVEKIKAASEKCGEKVWHLPCGEEFLEQMKSKIADLKNIGGKWGGACSAGAFLGEFAGDVDWAHIDMAGTGMFDGAKKYGSSGSIGYGVRLLSTFAVDYKK